MFRKNSSLPSIPVLTKSTVLLTERKTLQKIVLQVARTLELSLIKIAPYTIF